MAGQPGLFDLDQRYAALSASGDPLERLGLSADPKQFAMVADRYLEDLRRDVALGQGPARHLRDYEPVVDRYLKPFFGTWLIRARRPDDPAADPPWGALELYADR